MNTNAILLKVLVVSALMATAGFAVAEETTVEKVETKGNEAADSVKSTYRDVKDKTCEMINGKMECVGKKIKNKAKTAADKVETKATELKNKVD